MCNSVYKQTYCELPEGHEGAHRALIIEKPWSTRVEWNYTCPVCKQEKPLDIIYINRLGMCQVCAAQQQCALDASPTGSAGDNQLENGSRQ